MSIRGIPIRRTPNPYAKPDGRKNPYELNRDKPDLMALSRQDRVIDTKFKRALYRGLSDNDSNPLGPALYEVDFGGSPLPSLSPIKAITPRKS